MVAMHTSFQNKVPFLSLWVLGGMLFLIACRQLEPEMPGNWIKAGKTYSIEIQMETHLSQFFSNRTYSDTIGDFSKWLLHVDKEVKDTLWCRLRLIQWQDAEEVKALPEGQGIYFRVEKGKPVLDYDSLFIYTVNERITGIATWEGFGEKLGSRSKQRLMAWLQPNVVAHLLSVMFDVYPGGLPVAGRLWDGQLPVWHPVPGAFVYEGKIAALNPDAMNLKLIGRYVNVDAVNQTTLLPLGGKLSGNMKGDLIFPASGEMILRFSQQDSLFGVFSVAGRKVPSTVQVSKELTVTKVLR